MTRLILAAALALVALPLAAADPMTAEEFDAYTRGKTIFYGQDGQPYGVEEYRDNREVTWSFLDGRCLDGRWYEDDRGMICFEYEDGTGPQCWRFYHGPDGLRATFEDERAVPLQEAGEGEAAMQCLGPEVGV
ncbi:hypothetical protein [Rhodosalinus sp.]|uniref:hypothetical protein n=1 Tax=Rhodosalinus sp. TaxID=2047741 RepID=UPI00356A1888